MNKRTFIFSLMATLCSLHLSAQSKRDCKIAVISDIHIMAPDLLESEGKAFQNYVTHDRKMLKEGPALLTSAITGIIEKKPDIVLIAGDLTKDGEQKSHNYVAHDLLQPLRNAGIKVYVVPGNHDVNNPHAVIFKNDTTIRTTTVAPGEFEQIYKDYGYGQAIARDTHSLSYVAQLNDSIRLLAVDACRYEDNDYEKNTCVTGGRIKPETLDFIKTEAAKAQKKGIRMITLMHHGIVKHWKWQDKAMPEYLVEDWKKQVNLFGKLNLNLVFTGHFHAQDISCHGKGNQKVYDIETGSTVSYPMPYRIVELNKHQAKVSSYHIHQVPGFYSEEILVNYARKYAETGIKSIVRSVLPTKIPDSVAERIGEIMSEAYTAHLQGDERMTVLYPISLKNVCKELRHYSWKYAYILDRMGTYLYEDLYPEDNNTTIHY